MTSQRIESRECPHLERRVRRLVGRLRRRAVLATAARSLPPLQGIWAFWFLAWRLDWMETSPSSPEIVTGLAAILLAVLTVAAARSPRAQSAALVADRHLETREVLAAAVETDPGDRHPLALQVRRRALAALEPSRVRAALPLTRPAAWRGAALGVAALTLAALVPAPAEVEAAVEVDPAVAETGEALAEKLEELTDRFESVARPPAEDAFQRLEELVEALRQGEVATVEEALIELASFEETVLSTLPDAAVDDGLDEFIRDLAAEPQGAELAEAMTAADAEALRQALQGLAESLPSSAAEAAQRQQALDSLAQRFEDLASALDRDGRWAEAALLRQLADALRDGDFDHARELLGSGEVAEACRLGSRPSAGDDLAGDLHELVQLARHLLGVGLPQRLAEEGGGPGSGARGPGSGPFPGDDSTNAEGEGYETGDAVVRHRQTDATADRRGDFEARYESRLLEPGATEDLRTSGELGASGEMLSREGRGAGVEGPASLPLRPLSSAVAGTPEAATDLEDVPLGYRHLVREYFRRSPPAASEPRGDPP